MAMFYWSLGLIPWKDSFWTLNKPIFNCTYAPHCWEKNNFLQAAVAVLMGGPVTIGDGIFFSNFSLLNSLTNDVDNTILKPSVPAVYFPLTFQIDFDLPNSLLGSELLKSGSQIFYSYSQGKKIHYLLAANLTQSISVNAEQFFGEKNNLWSYNWHSGEIAPVSPLILPKNLIPKYVPNNTDCNDPPCDEKIDLNYFLVATELIGEFVIFGDVTKLISLADSVFSDFQIQSDEFRISVSASIGRPINVSIFSISRQKIITVACRGNAVLECSIAGGESICKC